MFDRSKLRKEPFFSELGLDFGGSIFFHFSECVSLVSTFIRYLSRMTEYAARYCLSRAMGVAQVGGGVTRERSAVAPFAEIKDSAPFAIFDKFTPHL